jgi:photosystem II protein PsbQ
MSKYRSILSLVLAFVATVIVGCSGPATPIKLTYTPEQIAEIQSYASQISALRDRLPELDKLIQDENWVFTRNFIHGPMGELRVTLNQAARNLFPEAQKQARQLAKQVAEDLEDIDRAAADQDYRDASRHYADAVKDFEAFLQSLPQGS